MARSAVVVLLLLHVGCSGKPGDAPPVDMIPDDPDSVTLYSIDGTERWDGKTTGEVLYGCPVLGSVAITDPAQRREVVVGVKNAIRTPAPRLACWMPRHVVRMTGQGGQIDVVICFECQGQRIYRDGLSTAAKNGTISPDGQAILDAILAKAGVPVVPKRH